MDPEHEVLRRVGLTDYGARAYLALVTLGPSGASEVANAAPLPRTKVYAVLRDLEERGWIDVEGGRPRTYVARRPGDCIRRATAETERLVEDALPRLEARYADRASRFAGSLWVLEGGGMVLERALEMIGRAREDVLLVASFPLHGGNGDLAAAVGAATRRGVRARVTVPDVGHVDAEAFRNAGAEVRTGRVPPWFLLIDGRHGIVAPPTPPGGVQRAIWNPSLELLGIMAPAILRIWEDAAFAAAGKPAPRDVDPPMP